MRRKGGRGAAATHGEPLRTNSRSGLALSRRHQGHCNEIERGRERDGAGERGAGGRRGRKMKMRGSRQREGGDSRKGGAH